MAKYNLMSRSNITTTVTSGTGNFYMDSYTVDGLYDGNTTTSGIELGDGDILFIDIDLYNRITVDSVTVYFDSIGDLQNNIDNITVYYKNTVNGDFTEINTAYVNSTLTIINNFELFAPLYIRIIFDSVSVVLYEVEVLNDDRSVLFGEDGLTTTITAENNNSYVTVPIYNNTDSVKSAYLSVNGEYFNSDYNIKLYTSESGASLGTTDSVLSIGTFTDNSYSFSKGKFYNTTLNSYGEVQSSSASELINTIGTFISIPLTDIAQDGQMVGWCVGMNAWSWNNNNDVYAIGRDINSTTLKLFKFDDITYTWRYLNSIFTSVSVGSWTNMACVGDYIYVLLNSSGLFGKYSLNDLSSEFLEPCPFGGTSKTIWAMTSDKEKYVYVAYGNGSDCPSTGGFSRYNTEDGIWEDLNSSFGTTTDQYHRATSMVMDYDTVNDLVLLNFSQYSDGTGNSNYIQSYSVEFGNWNTRWYKAFSTYNNKYRSFSYYGGYLVFSDTGANFISIYNTITSIKTSLNYYLENSNYSYVLSAPLAGGNSTGVFLAGLENSVYFSNDCIVIDTGVSTSEDFVYGNYVTPVLDVKDRFKSSFVYSQVDDNSYNYVSSGSSNINRTMLYRSSNSTPVPYSKMFHFYINGSAIKVLSYDLLTGDVDASRANVSAINTHVQVPDRVIFDRANCVLWMLFHETYYDASYRVLKYSLLDNTTVTYATSESYMFKSHFEVDGYGSVWAYNGTTLYGFSSTNLSSYITKSSDNNADFINSFSPNKLFNSCWYVDSNEHSVVHLHRDGTLISSFSIGGDGVVESLHDGGCVVADLGDKVIYRLDRFGNEINNFKYDTSMNIKAIRTDHDFVSDNYMYILNGDDNIIKMSFTGEEKFDLNFLFMSNFRSYKGGFICWDDTNKVTSIYNSDGRFLKKLDIGAYGFSYNGYLPDPILMDYDYINDREWQNLYDVEYDIGWKYEAWKEISSSNFNLPFNRYHQFKIEFKVTNKLKDPAVLRGIKISDAILLENIEPHDYKNAYLKIDYEDSINYKDYSSKLVCWWQN